MSIKTYRPITPARRHMTVSGFDGVDKHAAPEKSLVEVKKKNAGRNNYGRITVRHHGGGNRQKYRIMTSSATSATSRRRSSAWSTTPTAAPTSRWSNIPTASAATSSLRSVSPPVM